MSLLFAPHWFTERHHLIPIAGGAIVLLLVLLLLLLVLRRQRPDHPAKPRKQKRSKHPPPDIALQLQYGLAPTCERLRAEEARLDERQAALAASEQEFEQTAEERIARLTEWEQTLAAREAALGEREGARQEAYSSRELEIAKQAGRLAPRGGRARRPPPREPG